MKNKWLAILILAGLILIGLTLFIHDENKICEMQTIGSVIPLGEICY